MHLDVYTDKEPVASWFNEFANSDAVSFSLFLSREGASGIYCLPRSQQVRLLGGEYSSSQC